jgi:FkbM family methyltransferase
LFTDKNKTADFRLPFGLRLLRRLPFPKKLGLLGKMYGAILDRKGVVWVKTSAGPVWKLDLRNSTHRWIVYGDYEGPGFVSWAKRWVQSDSVVVDSGANIGQVLLYLAPRIKTGKYLAFEPFFPARQWLLECLQGYPRWPVAVEEFGLGEKTGTASLEGQWGGEEAVGSHTELKIGAGDIRITTLDDYAEKNSLGRIRLWKLDMEGSEERALRGAARLLKNGLIEALVVETDGNRFQELVKYLGAFGYQPTTWQGRPLQSKLIQPYGNILFRYGQK